MIQHATQIQIDSVICSRYTKSASGIFGSPPPYRTSATVAMPVRVTNATNNSRNSVVSSSTLCSGKTMNLLGAQRRTTSPGRIQPRLDLVPVVQQSEVHAKPRNAPTVLQQPVYDGNSTVPAIRSIDARRCPDDKPVVQTYSVCVHAVDAGADEVVTKSQNCAHSNALSEMGGHDQINTPRNNSVMGKTPIQPTTAVRLAKEVDNELCGSANRFHVLDMFRATRDACRVQEKDERLQNGHFELGGKPSLVRSCSDVKLDVGLGATSTPDDGAESLAKERASTLPAKVSLNTSGVQASSHTVERGTRKTLSFNVAKFFRHMSPGAVRHHLTFPKRTPPHAPTSLCEEDLTEKRKSRTDGTLNGIKAEPASVSQPPSDCTTSTIKSTKLSPIKRLFMRRTLSSKQKLHDAVKTREASDSSLQPCKQGPVENETNTKYLHLSQNLSSTKYVTELQQHLKHPSSLQIGELASQNVLASRSKENIIVSELKPDFISGAGCVSLCAEPELSEKMRRNDRSLRAVHHGEVSEIDRIRNAVNFSISHDSKILKGLDTERDTMSTTRTRYPEPPSSLGVRAIHRMNKRPFQFSLAPSTSQDSIGRCSLGVCSGSGSEVSLVRNVVPCPTSASKRTLTSQDNIQHLNDINVTAQPITSVAAACLANQQEHCILIETRPCAQKDTTTECRLPGSDNGGSSVLVPNGISSFVPNGVSTVIPNDVHTVLVSSTENSRSPSYLKLSRSVVGYTPYNNYTLEPTRVKSVDSTPQSNDSWKTSSSARDDSLLNGHVVSRIQNGNCVKDEERHDWSVPSNQSVASLTNHGIAFSSSLIASPLPSSSIGSVQCVQPTHRDLNEVGCSLVNGIGEAVQRVEAAETSETVSAHQQDASPQKDGAFFLRAVAMTEEELRKRCARTELDLQQNVSDDIEGRIRAAVGKATLLTNKKFKQFRQLCAQNMNPSNLSSGESQRATTCQDLAGFWDMVLIQVEDVTRQFDELDRLRLNDWRLDELATVHSSSTSNQGLTSSNTHTVQSPTSCSTKSFGSKTNKAAAGSATPVSSKSAEMAKAREVARQRLLAAKLAGRQRKASESDRDVEIFIA